MPNSMENHNPKVRRRNVNEEITLLSTGSSQVCDESKESCLTSNGHVPRVPLICDPESEVLDVNGDLVNEEDLSFEDLGEAPMDRERTKLGVIERSFERKDVTVSELRLLGCSEEGLVNGKLDTIFLFCFYIVEMYLYAGMGQ